MMRSETIEAGEGQGTEVGNNRTDRLILTSLLATGLLIGCLSVAADWLKLDSRPGVGWDQAPLLANGLALSLADWGFGKMEQVDARSIWLTLLVCLLALGVAIRIVEVTYDKFDSDEYILMIDIDQRFSDYINSGKVSHQIHYLVHYWLSYRLLGNSLIAYRPGR